MSETETSWDQPSRSDCPLRRSDQHSWDPNHLQSTGREREGGREGEERAAGLESPGVGCRTPALCRPASCSHLAARSGPLGRCLWAALAGDGRTDRQTHRIAFPPPGEPQAICSADKVKSLVGRRLR